MTLGDGPFAHLSSVLSVGDRVWGDVPIASALVDTSLDDWRPDVRSYRRIVDAAGTPPKR